MKRKNLLIALILSIFIFIGKVNAADCIVVSGTGKNIGDEISCGTENFYVLSNDGTNVKMLAKYNLYVGVEMYYIEFEDPLEFSYSYSYSSETGSLYTYNNVSYSWSDMFNAVLKDNGYETYDGFVSYSMDNTTYTTNTTRNSTLYWIKAYNNLEYDSVLQSSEAIGTHGPERGVLEFPEIGDVLLDYHDIYDLYETSTSDNYGTGFKDINLEDEPNIKEYLQGYISSLNNLGIKTTDISLLSVADIDDLVYQISGNNLPLDEWYATWQNDYTSSQYDNTVYNASVLGSISEYVSSEYDWLFNTTYWTKTTTSGYYVYFVDTLGYLCSDLLCTVSDIGAGIRPVVTIASEDLSYNIYTKTNNNGIITVSNNAKEGEKVTFTITPNDGYSLGSLKITDANGNTVTYTEGYTFTMPASDVTIEATFVKNPETQDIAISIITILAILAIIVVIDNKNKLKWLNK